MSVDLQLSAYNLEGGGLKADGSYNFDNLLQAFTEAPSPHLINLCEAKFWQARGQKPFRTALRELSTLTGRPYVGELFTGPLGTAVIYDPTVLHLDAGEEPDFPDKRNLARFCLREHPSYRFWAFTEHWSSHDGDQRLARARLLARYGRSEIPTLIAGDTNSSYSGPTQPTINWQRTPVETRDYKGRLINGVWGPDTRALDRLVGTYDHHSGQRINRGGFHDVTELDPDAPNPLPPTGAIGLQDDHILINNAFRTTADIVQGSYHVHLPPGAGPTDWPNDHRRVSCTLRIRPPHPAADADGSPP